MALAELLPIEDGNWAHLNDFLSVSLNPNGTLKSGGGSGTVLENLPITPGDWTRINELLAVSFNADGTPKSGGGTSTVIERLPLQSGNWQRLMEWLAVSFNPDGTLKAAARQSVTTTVNNLGDGSFMVGSALFCVTQENPARLVKWPNVADLSTYSVLTFPADGTYGQPQGMTYDAVTGLGYIPFSFDQSLTLDPPNVRIVKFDPANPAGYTTLANPQMGSAGTTPGNSVAVSDGTNLYVLTKSNLEASWIYKIRLSDGVVVASRQFADTRAFRGHSIQYDSAAGKLCFSGTKLSPNNGWYGTINLDLTGESFITVGTGTHLNDDSLILGSNYWTPDETAATGVVWKIAKDGSAQTSYPTGFTVALDGLAYDGTYLWTAALTTPNTLVAINPATGAVARTIALQPGETGANELYAVGGNMIVLTLTSPALAIAQSLA